MTVRTLLGSAGTLPHTTYLEPKIACHIGNEARPGSRAALFQLTVMTYKGRGRQSG